MVLLQLSIKAELENVSGLVPATDSDFDYVFEVLKEQEVSGGKGSTAHFVWSCGECERKSSAKFAPTQDRPYTAENAQFAPLLEIECRGLEFIGFNPMGTWKCKGTTSGTVFSDVVLEDGEWFAYDEKAKLPVRIYDLESKWSRAP
ncbi:hypothetical protein H0H92_007019 [Tricholoma furcatifolium]|nr:hypothetical protein H0H92_007019 [Tricholoma furcatifolium]